MDVSSIGSDRSSTSMSISDSSSVLLADEGVRASDVEARKQATIDTSNASRASDNGIVVVKSEALKALRTIFSFRSVVLNNMNLDVY